MMHITFVIIFFASLISCVFAAPENAPLKPSEDDFYRAPDGYEDKDPGTILKVRKTPFKLRSVYVTMNVKDSWQFMVRTTDALGEPSYAVSTLIEPYNANNSRLLSYQIAEDSSSVDCSASYTFLKGASMTTIAGQAESLLIQTGLNEGYWVNVPDYEGPIAAFTAGRMAGHATLDSIRGALKLSNMTNLNSACDIVLWGYSGGALASGWTAALQPTYAPDLSGQLLGAAMGGLPANITYTILGIDGTLYAGLLPAGIFGLSQAYPVLKKYIENYLPAKYNWIMNKAKSACLVPACVYMAYSQFFKGENRMVDSGYALFAQKEVYDTLTNTTLGVDNKEMPTIPIFEYHGLHDGIVPIDGSLNVYTKWCANGIGSFEQTISNKTRHISEALFGAPAAFTWIKNRFDHGPVVKGCTQTYRTNNLLYPGIASNTLDIFQDIVKTLLGFKIGPSSLNKRDEDHRLTEVDEEIDRRLFEEHLKMKSKRSYFQL